MTNDERAEIFKDLEATALAIGRRTKLLQPFYDKQSELKDRLKKGCDRTCGFVQKKSDYNNGSYYDSPYTIHWESCSVCGYHKELPTENHGRYG